MQHPHSLPLPPPPSQHLSPPSKKLIAPPTPHQHPTNHINNSNQQRHKPTPLLPNSKQDRFDIKLEKDTGHATFVDGVALRGDGVLVGEDCGRRGGARVRGAGVDGGDDGAVVLEFVEVFGGGGVGFVEGVEEGGVEGAEGELVDGVGEVECCFFSLR